MSSVVDRVRDARGRHRPAAAAREAQATRAAQLRRFLRAVDGYLPEQTLVTARTVADRAEERLGLSPEHTVVALAGATGSGKSSIFNAVTGLQLSQVGVRRPTTGVTHACAWGASKDAGALLDWLGVPPNRRFDRVSSLDGDEITPLGGLVLLDLPDIDSVEESHHGEVDRLLRLVDLVVWVLDPQKYADAAVHERYLRHAARYRDVTVVVLNQIDTLGTADARRCLDDLRRLLDAEGLDQVPLLATSAVSDGGLDALLTPLEERVAAQDAYLRRLAADLTDVTDVLASLVTVEAGEELVDRGAVRQLVDTLAAAAGVPAALEAVERGYLHRASLATGWPLSRWAGSLRPDPLRRLHLDGTGGTGTSVPGDGAAAETRIASPEAKAAQRAAVTLAARDLAERSAHPLPAVWHTAAVATALARRHDVPDAMDTAVARADLAVGHRPRWWRTVRLLQWLSTGTALVALGWLAAGYAGRALGSSALVGPRVGRVPLAAVLLLAGLLLGLLLALGVRPLVRLASRHARRIAERRLRAAIAEVASDLVVAPVRALLRAYADARTALAKAR